MTIESETELEKLESILRRHNLYYVYMTDVHLRQSPFAAALAVLANAKQMIFVSDDDTTTLEAIVEQRNLYNAYITELLHAVDSPDYVEHVPHIIAYRLLKATKRQRFMAAMNVLQGTTQSHVRDGWQEYQQLRQSAEQLAAVYPLSPEEALGLLAINPVSLEVARAIDRAVAPGQIGESLTDVYQRAAHVLRAEEQ